MSRSLHILPIVTLLLFAGILSAVGGDSNHSEALQDTESAVHKTSPAQEAADPESKSEPTPGMDAVLRWQNRINDVLSSKSEQWKRKQLQTISKELSGRRYVQAGESDLALLKVMELAQWSLRDVGSARATVERRYNLLAVRLNPAELAERAYGEGARYSKRNLPGAARELYALVAKISPSHPKAIIADRNIGVILRRERTFAAAESHFLRLVQKYEGSHPEHVRQFHYQAGDCAWRAHNMKRAEELFGEVVRLYPGTPEADAAGHMVKDVRKGEKPEDLRPGYRPPGTSDNTKRKSPSSRSTKKDGE